MHIKSIFSFMEADQIGSAEGQNFTYVLKKYIFAIDKKFELTSSFVPNHWTTVFTFLSFLDYLF